MLSFHASTQIAAEASVVWDTLVETDRWPDWDSNIERIDGRLAEGARITLRMTSSSRPFKIRVVAWDRPNRLVFRSGMPLGLFTGTRTYELQTSAEGTQFEMDEQYTGPLAPLIGRSIPDLQPSFDSFVAGLRRAAETAQSNR